MFLSGLRWNYNQRNIEIKYYRIYKPRIGLTWIWRIHEEQQKENNDQSFQSPSAEKFRLTEVLSQIGIHTTLFDPKHFQQRSQSLFDCAKTTQTLPPKH